MRREFLSDTELLAALAEGDSKAFEVLYRQYYPIISKWMVKRGGREDDVKDAFQDSLMVLYDKAQDTEFCLTSRLGTYLFSVCKKIWLKKINRNSADLIIDDEDSGLSLRSEETDIAVFFEKESNLKKLDLAIEELGNPCADLIRAFYWKKKSMTEIAEQFHYTNTDNAKTQKYKCLNRLRKIFNRIDQKEKDYNQ